MVRQSVIRSVFPPAPFNSTEPTPHATPINAQTSFGESEDISAGLWDASAGTDSASEIIHWERSWHVATSFFTELFGSGSKTITLAKCPQIVQKAVYYVRSPMSVGFRLRQASQADDLLWWYSQAVQSLFLKRHVPALKSLCPVDCDGHSWSKFANALAETRALLLGPFCDLLIPLSDMKGTPHVAITEANFSALVAETFAKGLEEKLVDLIFDRAWVGLVIPQTNETLNGFPMEGIEDGGSAEAIRELVQTLTTLVHGGFEEGWVERLLANGCDKVICTFVRRTFAKRWASPSPCVTELKLWISGPFTDMCSEVLVPIARNLTDSVRYRNRILATDIADWQRRAVDELGRLRLLELFDIIVDWEHGSKGGIEDLRHYLCNPARRVFVINAFTEALTYRLLIPSASTLEILQIYMRTIRAFALLDPRLVILDRVGRPIRRYLREREDTVKIVVTGLLADPDDTETPNEALVELAIELHHLEKIAGLDEDFELDWDDVKWLPNPADAEPDFKKSKALDVIGNLISLAENKETLVREFQNILGERLLGVSIDFDREIRVLELLKSRFGDAALQGCEVMLKDIFDSRRTDILIKKEQDMESTNYQQPQIYAKILSRFFWPSLRGDEFLVPASIQAIQGKYAQGFEEHKMQRKLAWLPALGQVTVELILKHRTVQELVTTWQASVIYAFSDDHENAAASRRTADQLAAELRMDNELVANALTFWVSKLVLYEPEPGTYEVLEVLPTEEDADSAAGEQKASAHIVAAAQSASAAAAASAASAVRSEEELAEEKMDVVWQYVMGMLTNQGSMPLQQMVMMLNFVVPGGFSHSNEDFRSFLQRRVDDGRLEMTGANYKIPKNASK